MNGNVLVMSLAIAVEPLPILAGVLLLTTKGGRQKAVALLAGWALVLAVIGVVIVVVGGQVSVSSGPPSTFSAALDVVLGLVLVVLALRQRGKARHGDGRTTPGWMTKLDTMSPWATFGLGMFLPPYVLAAAVGNDIVRQSLSQSQRIGAMVLYVIIGSLGLLIPVAITLVRPSQSGALLASWRVWLQANWQIVLFWTVIVIGLYLVVKGSVELVRA